MNIRFLGVLVGILLFVALIFSASTAARLRNEMTQTNDALNKAEDTIAQLRKEIDATNAIPAQATPIESSEHNPTDQTDEELATSIELDPSFVLRAHDGKIGVFTAEGYLIRTVDVDIQTLPAADRNALESGIYVFSKKELDAKIEDFER